MVNKRRPRDLKTTVVTCFSPANTSGTTGQITLCDNKKFLDSHKEFYKVLVFSQSHARTIYFLKDSLTDRIIFFFWKSKVLLRTSKLDLRHKAFVVNQQGN